MDQIEFCAFTIELRTGSVVTWGSSTFGGDSSSEIMFCRMAMGI